MTPRQFTHGGRPVPYIAAWTGEPHTTPRAVLLVHRGMPGVGYPIEQLMDRDEQGRLWARQTYAPGRGEPQFETVHTLRQRQVMRRKLCQVCGGSTLLDSGERLWLLAARPAVKGPVRQGEVTASPPICPPCARTSLEHCPHLQQGAVAARVRYASTWGIAGVLYERAGAGLRTVPGHELTLIPEGAPGLLWTVAHRIAVELRGVTPLDLAELRATQVPRR